MLTFILTIFFTCCAVLGVFSIARLTINSSEEDEYDEDVNEDWEDLDD